MGKSAAGDGLDGGTGGLEGFPEEEGVLEGVGDDALDPVGFGGRGWGV